MDGAARTGLVTGLVNGHGRPCPSSFHPPDVEAANLLDAVDVLPALVQP